MWRDASRYVRFRDAPLEFLPHEELMSDLIAYMEPAGTPGWARFRLDSGDRCWMGVTDNGVTVKRSGLGLLGRTLYKESNPTSIALTSAALSTLYPDSAAPSDISDATFISFANAILHCWSAGEVENVLGRAVSRVELQIDGGKG
jgi:hypothetical protein